MTDQSSAPPILDYDATGAATYREDFWENANRHYEDRAERIAIRRLLQPPHGQRLLELGAGFGRLSASFEGYDQVIIMDYARSQLLDARARLGDSKYIYVAADLYRLPIADGACDAATLIRVIHHLADVPAALAQIRATLAPGALFLLEYANKRNAKAMVRYALGRQDWNPYTADPVEFVALHFDFHPAYIRQELLAAGFQPGRALPVSYFRLGILKRLIPASILAGADGIMQQTGWLYAPSIFTRSTVPGERPAQLPETVFKCPACAAAPLAHYDARMTCTACGAAYALEDGIYDFRQPL
ncbi:MAG: class I SAM-dependent methyltransferase [Anaerolineales bacterium]